MQRRRLTINGMGSTAMVAIHRWRRCYWLQVSFVLPANSTAPSTLDVTVHALGRFNFGCVWDTKGLQNRGQLESSNVTLNGGAEHPVPACALSLPCAEYVQVM